MDLFLSSFPSHYASLFRFLSVRCKMYFDSMLSQRGYIGKMMFEHKNETLSISVRIHYSFNAQIYLFSCTLLECISSYRF